MGRDQRKAVMDKGHDPMCEGSPPASHKHAADPQTTTPSTRTVRPPIKTTESPCILKRGTNSTFGIYRFLVHRLNTDQARLAEICTSRI